MVAPSRLAVLGFWRWRHRACLASLGGGIVFSLILGLMFRNWARQIKLDKEDKHWLRQAHRYAVHDESDLPESGRFNAGQKMLFWLSAF